MGVPVEVEADWGGVRAAGADDGEGVAGFDASDEEARRREGAWNVDDLAGEGGQFVRAVGGSWGAGEGGEGVICWVAVCCHCG